MKDLQSQSKTEVVSCDSDTIFQVACLDTEVAFFIFQLYIACLLQISCSWNRGEHTLTSLSSMVDTLTVVEGKYPVKSILET